MLNRLSMKIKVFNVTEGEWFEGNSEQVRVYVEDLFEEFYGFRLLFQANVDNGEFHLLLNRSNKLDDEQQKVVDKIYCYRPLTENQSRINKKHTDNLEDSLFLNFIY